jgi:septal ring factor EnvC (AmiA/AmiB activator)
MIRIRARLSRTRLGLAIALAACAGLAGATTTAPLERLNAAEAELVLDQGSNMNRLARLLSVLERLSRDPPPALLVSADDARDAVRAAILVRAITPELQARARGYAQGASEMLRQRRLAAVQSEALFETDSLTAEELPEPEDPNVSALQGPVGPDPALDPPARLRSPAPGNITRRFGAALPGGGRSAGLTLSVTQSARAISPAAGRVQYVGPVKGWDVIVILRLVGGYHLVLAGLERASVEVGQSVSEGQPLGFATQGSGGRSELYLEVREQGSPVDPGQWMVAER